jgi:AcrR family transcriptional regulator
MSRPTYHHGDLFRALVTASLDLVRAGGPDAVTVREVARRLEVSPAAIYRHFPDREALLGEVARQVRQDLARRLLEEAAGIDAADPRVRSIRRFLALGRGYIGFARDAPNLLAAAFLPIAPPGGEAEDPNPWQILASALDDLVAAGAMPPERRAGAEVIAWSAVHGFATLRANRSFETSGEPEPDPEMLLEAIARALGLEPGAQRTSVAQLTPTPIAKPTA